MTKRWIKNSKISNRLIGKLIDLFVLEIPAIRAAKIVKLNRHSVDRVYLAIRQKLLSECDKEFLKTVRDSRSLQHENVAWFNEMNTQLFGLIKVNNLVFIQPILDMKPEDIKRMTKTNFVPGKIRNGYSFNFYEAVILDKTKYIKISPYKNRTKNKMEVGGTENFWSYTKTKLKKYYGTDKHHFVLYLKEMEFRYNNRDCKDLSQLIRKLLACE